MNNNKDLGHVAIFGAGLVGSLLGIMLARRGYQVSIYEQREDISKQPQYSGRSINMAMSERGLKALRLAGIETQVKDISVQMDGRLMHSRTGELAFQPYGEQGQAIYSVSRSNLNKQLLKLANELENLTIYYSQKCTEIDFQAQTAKLLDSQTNETTSINADYFVGADGSFSAVRAAMMRNFRFDYSQSFIEHGYKELTLPALPDGTHALQTHALHIWPRGHYMIIALPNPEGSFTCTLFFPYHGSPSFETIDTIEKADDFFKTQFADLYDLIPDISQQFFANPTAALFTIRCSPWIRTNTLLIGDAAHAIVPFYGQGMNAGFEDCSILDGLLESGLSFGDAAIEFQKNRKTDTDAIADLALENFVEMRDKVALPDFLLRKKLEAKLHLVFGNDWIPIYSLISFSNTNYYQAKKEGQRQQKILDYIIGAQPVEKSLHDENSLRQCYQQALNFIKTEA